MAEENLAPGVTESGIDQAFTDTRQLIQDDTGLMLSRDVAKQEVWTAVTQIFLYDGSDGRGAYRVGDVKFVRNTELQEFIQEHDDEQFNFQLVDEEYFERNTNDA